MEKTFNKILVIDDEENMCHMLQVFLGKNGYRVDTACDGAEGLEKISRQAYDVVLCDLKMPRLGGIELLKQIGSQADSLCIIMMSAYGTIDTAIEAIKLGAFDFISKPFKPAEVLIALDKAREQRELKNENTALKKQIHRIESRYQRGNIIAKSAEMQSIFRLLEKIYDYDTTVLITGDSGTGKELIARAVYFNSNRRTKSFVPINCGSIPENLLESELFGYVKGAFTGADKTKAGLFEEADKGVLFLDEIGELPLSLQVKLLRVLQEKEIRPVGSSIQKKIDTRVIAATSRDLKQEVEKGTFREDLFFRLNVIRINLPPLSRRKEDIPLLCDFFIRKYNQKFDKQITKIHPRALSHLLNYPWPGNIRELENTIERVVLLSDNTELMVDDIPFESHPDCADDVQVLSDYSLKKAISKIEKEFISNALKVTEGNRTQTSKLLGISHPSLLAKMKKYQIR